MSVSSPPANDSPNEIWTALRKMRLVVVPERKALYFIAPAAFVFMFIASIGLHRGDGILSPGISLLVQIIQDGAPIAIMAMGAALVLSSGGVDLSSAGVATAGGVVFAASVHAGIPPLVSIAIALVLGLSSGVFLGLLVHRRTPALIASWAIGSLWFIAAIAFSSSSIFGDAGGPTGISFAVKGTWMDLWVASGMGVEYSLTTLVIIVGALGFSHLPRRCCAIGANRESAMFAGIRVRPTLLMAYGTAGLLSALAGIASALLGARALTTDLAGRELTAIAVAVLGGTVMTGGYLNLLSVISASMLWTLIRMDSHAVLFPNLPHLQQRVADAAFALVILLMVGLVGSRLTENTLTILTNPRTRERR